ncbi:MAG: maleylpyruvate isomerase family mycothiol-dependent enzyme [Acidimicrobiaceae bacterium]|nr:maleylpyruvate isomerase family mycothiol-dependent enzyme [Acidimicrobiaceae bacterium]
MNIEPTSSRPSTAIEPEANALLETIDATLPAALSACSGWTAHEITAHLAAGSVEIALNLEAYGEGKSVPATRGFEERETPFRAMDEKGLRKELPKSIARMANAIDAVLAAEPDAVVPWTGRQMAVATFITHMRSELAIHRWDLVGDDEKSLELLALPDLTNHAITVLGRVLLSRGGASATTAFSASLRSPGDMDIVVKVDVDGARLTRSDEVSQPSITGDRAALLLFLWGRRPGDPRRLTAPLGRDTLAKVEALLVGY